MQTLSPRLVMVSLLLAFTLPAHPQDLSNIQGGPVEDVKKGWQNFLKDIGSVGREINRDLNRQGDSPPPSRLRIALLLHQNLPSEAQGEEAFSVIVSELTDYLLEEKNLEWLKERSGLGQAPRSASDFRAYAQGLPAGSFGIMEIRLINWKKLTKAGSADNLVGHAAFDIEFRFAGKAGGLADDSPSRWSKTASVTKSINKQQWEAYVLKVLKESYDAGPGQDIEFRPVFLAMVIAEAFASVADTFPKPGQ